jgi:pimeloyl-ACP methyl ester carboxylesterase
MATFVLVHGGGHGGWCWQRLAPLLRAQGHEVYAPTLTGLGERAHLLNPRIDLDTHIDDVVGVLRYEGLADVILVGHSYGGAVITGVADRALSRIRHLVFLDALHARDGESLEAAFPEVMSLVRSQARVVDGVELVLWPTDEACAGYEIADPDDLAWAMKKLTPHPWKCFEQPLRLANEAAVRKLPSTNINATWNQHLRPASVRERQLAGERVWPIDTGHDLMINEPQLVAEMLCRVAAL